MVATRAFLTTAVAFSAQVVGYEPIAQQTRPEETRPTLVRAKPVMTMCEACGKLNNVDRKPHECSACGQPLGPAPIHW